MWTRGATQLVGIRRRTQSFTKFAHHAPPPYAYAQQQTIERARFLSARWEDVRKISSVNLEEWKDRNTLLRMTEFVTNILTDELIDLFMTVHLNSRLKVWSNRVESSQFVHETGTCRQSWFFANNCSKLNLNLVSVPVIWSTTNRVSGGPAELAKWLDRCRLS